MKGGELAENEERAVGLALVLSTFVRKKEVEVKEVEVKEEKMMEGIKTADLHSSSRRDRGQILQFLAFHPRFLSGGASQGGFDMHFGEREEHRG